MWWSHKATLNLKIDIQLKSFFLFLGPKPHALSLIELRVEDLPTGEPGHPPDALASTFPLTTTKAALELVISCRF